MKTVITTHGYLAVFLPGHPMAAKNGYIYAHRLVMAKHLGRTLNREEQVHHKDNDKTNNRISNLEILTDEQHREKHRKRKDLRPIGSPNPIIKCGCGCGQELPMFDAASRPRKFISGHNKNMANTKGIKNPKKGVRRG